MKNFSWTHPQLQHVGSHYPSLFLTANVSWNCKVPISDCQVLLLALPTGEVKKNYIDEIIILKLWSVIIETVKHILGAMVLQNNLSCRILASESERLTCDSCFWHSIFRVLLFVNFTWCDWMQLLMRNTICSQCSDYYYFVPNENAIWRFLAIKM